MRPAALRLPLLCACVALPVALDPGAPAAAPARQERDPAQDSGPEPEQARVPGPLAPRRAVAGLRGFVSRSTLVFDELPEVPHALEAVFVFPDRGRWRIEPAQASSGDRRLRFRYGPSVFELDPGSARSRRLEPEAERPALLQMELRRAVMTWPHGFDWTGTGQARSAGLGPLGELEASLDPQTGLPRELRSLQPDGSALEILSEITWRECDGRRWPASWRLAAGGRPIWRETIERIETGWSFLDSYFLPPDRRPAAPPDAGRPQHLDLPRRVERAFALPEGTSWEEARTRAASLRATWAERLELHPATEFELRADGRPAAVRLRLRDAGAEAPEGWRFAPGGPGLSSLAETPEGIDAALLRGLAGAVPVGATGGTPYTSQPPGSQAGGRVQVVLPIEPRD